MLRIALIAVVIAVVSGSNSYAPIPDTTYGLSNVGPINLAPQLSYGPGPAINLAPQLSYGPGPAINLAPQLSYGPGQAINLAPQLSYGPGPINLAPLSYGTTVSSYGVPAKINSGRQGKLLGVTYLCKGKTNIQLADSKLCDWFHQCSNGLDLLMPCPYGLQWASRYQRCMYPSQSDCGAKTKAGYGK